MTTHATSLRPYIPQLLFVGGIALTLLVLGILGAASLPRLENMGAITSYSLIALGTILAACLIYAVHRIRNSKTQSNADADSYYAFRRRFQYGLAPDENSDEASKYLTHLLNLNYGVNILPKNGTLTTLDDGVAHLSIDKKTFYNLLMENRKLCIQFATYKITFTPKEKSVDMTSEPLSSQ